MTDGTRGLEGVVAAVSSVSSIVGDTLTYRGYDVEELARHSNFEEVTYLLWHGNLPKAEELAAFNRELRANRTLPRFVVDLIGRVPADVDAMAALRTVVSALCMDEPLETSTSRASNVQKAVSLAGSLPTAIAALYRARIGWESIDPDLSLDESSNFLSMVFGHSPSPVQSRALDVALIAHADHEFNASTFAARVAASTLTNLHGAVVAALATLAGPLHGGASARVMTMLEDIGNRENVRPYLTERLRRQDAIPGFGHRVYSAGDPRARILKPVAAELASENGDSAWYEISIAVQEVVQRETGLLPNVDFYAASVYTYLGLPTFLFAPLFAWGRTSGWIAHILEQYDNNRLIRPRAEYVGSAPRSYTSIQER